MDNVYYDEKRSGANAWIRPWMQETFDNLYDRDERFFAILIKGALGWLTSNIILYNKPIRHFIWNTGSSWMYVESNGYQFSWEETSGEDQMYMQMPRCITEIGEIRFPIEELTQPNIRGTYERRCGNDIKGYNAEMRRMPVEMTLELKYVLSNMNEALILTQELADKMLFQKYFTINYLGQHIECSIEFSTSTQIELNKIDMSSPDTNQKILPMQLTIATNYPIIDTRTEVPNDCVIADFSIGDGKFTDRSTLFRGYISNTTDVISKENVLSSRYDSMNENI